MFWRDEASLFSATAVFWLLIKASTVTWGLADWKSPVSQAQKNPPHQWLYGMLEEQAEGNCCHTNWLTYSNYGDERQNSC